MNPVATTRLQHALGFGPVGTPSRPIADTDWGEVQRAIRDGADIDAPLNGNPSWTLLTHAIRWEGFAMVWRLLDQGADPNAAGLNGHKPLSDAAALGHTEIARLLLDRGADMEAIEFGREGDAITMPAVMRAAWWVRTGTASMFLARGADPNAHNTRGATVLMVVAMGLTPANRDAAGLIGVLLDAGANPLRTDAEGRAVPEVFADRQRVDLLEALDTELVRPRRATVRRRLLDRLTADRRTAWLPKSCAAEAALRAAKAWSRKP